MDEGRGRFSFNRANSFRNIKMLCLTLILLTGISSFLVPSAFAAEIDTTFAPAVTKDVTSDVTGQIALQPDGKVLISGVFQTGGTYLIRLNSDGTQDSTFNCSICGRVNVGNVLVLANGKIILAGYTDVAKVYRLNSDGSLDIEYGVDPFSGLGFVYEIEVLASQPDGKILVRHRSSALGYGLQEIYRYDANGIRDTSFTTNGYGPLRFSHATYSRVMVLPDGKILFGGTISGFNSVGFIYRTNADGTQDSSFEQPVFLDPGNRTSVGNFDVYPDGKIIIPGQFTAVNSISKTDLVRLHPAGNVDLDFDPGSVFSSSGIFTGKARVLSEAKVLVSTVAFNPVISVPADNELYRFNSDGTLDVTFADPAALTVLLNWTPDGSERVLVFGVLDGITRYLRLESNGVMDTGFNPDLVKHGIVHRLAVQTDGKILLAGDFNRVNGTLINNFSRVNPDGTLDTTFDAGSGFNAVPSRIVVQPDGKILAIGDFTSFNGTPVSRIARLNANGSIDSAFNPQFDGSVLEVIPLPSGQIIVGGGFTTVGGNSQRAVARLNSDGGLDSSFNPLFGSGSVDSIVAEADGKMTVGGGFSGVNGFNRSNLVRLNADGTLDTTFNAGTISAVTKVIKQTDGKYMLLQSSALSRRNSDGTADPSFQSPTINGTVNAVHLLPDGKILVGGGFYLPRHNFAMFLPNGTIDSTFFPTGANNSVYAIVGHPDGKVVVGGNFVLIGNVLRSSVARITIGLVQTQRQFDYDGDGRSDVSVFRPSTNRWYEFLSSNSTVTEQTFGVSGDVVAPADYDGDGKTDIGIFRPSTGDWWYLSSVSGAQIQTHWGAAGDIPRPSDFDGDGKSDFIVFRPSENNWYRFSSMTGISIINFGLAGDKPVTGDFDGDGKSDLAIYRPSTGTWWYRSSIDGAQIATRWGIAEDIPAPADYDGDGKTDLAVYRPSTGIWYIYNSGNASAQIVRFGLEGDKPVAADYDGDGKADIALFRPSTGVWYFLNSTSGFSAMQFGVSTDQPTPNAYVP